MKSRSAIAAARLFAAGLITGEALHGHHHRRRDLQDRQPRSARAAGRACRSAARAGEWVGLAVLGVVGYWMYSVGKRKAT